jgi:putative chitinase
MNNLVIQELVTAEQLISVMPECSHVIVRFVDPLNEAFERFEISTPLRKAAFLAQAGHESTRFIRTEENLNYSANGLMRTFPDYFTPEQAKEFAYKPARIANKVYANKGGNGNEESGDGWKYRGRGVLQVGYMRNYLFAGKRLTDSSRTFLDDPDLLLLPEWSVRAACDYWDANDLNIYADRNSVGEFKALTRKINRGLRGLDDRTDLWRIAKKVLDVQGEEQP